MAVLLPPYIRFSTLFRMVTSLGMILDDEIGRPKANELTHCSCRLSPGSFHLFKRDFQLYIRGHVHLAVIMKNALARVISAARFPWHGSF